MGVHKVTCRDDLHLLVEKCWDLDHIGIKDRVRSAGMSKNFRRPKSAWSPQEIEVDEAMKVVKHNKFYSCSIPWKTKPPDLSNNRVAVEKRQRKTNSFDYLSNKGTSISEIDAVFQDQIKKGYIEEISDPKEIDREDCFYIPYFPVVDRSRPTTKVRVVFDAAAKTRNGSSLNSKIQKGPNRLQDLFTILLSFRQFEVALTADISEMFLQCRLSEEDRRYHRFWWNDRYWQWTRILFGNLSSPDISQKVLEVNAELYKDQFPHAAETIIKYCYMDDAIRSVETIAEGIAIVQELDPLLSHADMKMRKFHSNKAEVLKVLPKEWLSAKVNFDKDEGSIFEPSKVLGIIWDANIDSFVFTSKFKSDLDFIERQGIKDFKHWTKSLILRLSATVFDPLGLISPFTVRSRKILQRLWQEELTWEDPIPERHDARWRQWLKELFTESQLVNIPRCLNFGKSKTISLHVFVDASTEVYATAVFVRVAKVVDSRGVKELEAEEVDVESHLVTSKARVAPIKAESVSRLELDSAVIGLRLGHAVALAYQIDPKQIYYWTDSTNVLYWINTPANQLKTFVSNRVGEIQSDSDAKQWRHVPTDQNPADVATRDISLADLAKNHLWWKGPEWLTQDKSFWPVEFASLKSNDDVKKEFKKLFSDHTFVYSADGSVVSKLEINKHLNPLNFSVGSLYDGFNKLLHRVFATLLAYSKWRKLKFTRSSLLRRSLEILVTQAQTEDPVLQTTINEVHNEEQLSQLKSYSPFISETGVLRSNSRLARIEHLSYDIRFPIILSTRSYLTKLLVLSYHQKYGHSVSIENVKHKLREGFIILGLTQFLQKLTKTCMFCKKLKNKPLTQRMADLPAYRFSMPLRAFSKVGIDFAGPLHIKQLGRGKPRLKSYILVFSCLQTRAIHLEATESQDTDSVLNAFSRFTSIRGMPLEVLSDNWKAFVTEDKELQSWVRYLDDDLIIKSELANVIWHFTPPYGPHHGGTYEIMVKASKRALDTLCKRADLTMDEFRTVLSRVCALLNGRPLTRVVEEGVTYVLTPNHFLFGNLGGAVCSEDVDHPKKRWQKVSALVDHFWEQFMREYLPLLSKRKRWQELVKDLEVGELVLQIDPNIPRGQWKLAIVEEVYPSESDQKVRRCRIKTSDGTYDRPITQLVSLEFKTMNEN